MREARLEEVKRVRDSRSSREELFPRDTRAGRRGSDVERDTRSGEGTRDARDVADLLSDVNARVSGLSRDVSRVLRGNALRSDSLSDHRDTDVRMRKRGKANLLSTRVDSDPDSLFSDVQAAPRSDKPHGNNTRTDPRNLECIRHVLTLYRVYKTLFTRGS